MENMFSKPLMISSTPASASQHFLFGKQQAGYTMPAKVTATSIRSWYLETKLRPQMQQAANCQLAAQPCMKNHSKTRQTDPWVQFPGDYWWLLMLLVLFVLFLLSLTKQKPRQQQMKDCLNLTFSNQQYGQNTTLKINKTEEKWDTWWPFSHPGQFTQFDY